MQAATLPPWPFARITKRRGPDFIIGGAQEPYLRRWWLIPRNRWLNIYLHQFIRSDEDRALHDHPWWWCSIILRGDYLEHTPRGTFFRRALRPRIGRAKGLHRVELLPERRTDGTMGLAPVWTLFVTGPRIRDWGFACPKGWRPWQEFTDSRDKGLVGRGCDD